MKKNLFVIPVVLVFVLSACFTPDKNMNASAKNAIYVSIPPQKYLVEQIAGETFAVHALLPPGASPAIYEPTPAQLRQLSGAKAYIRIGYIGFELAWMDRIASTNKKMIIFDQSKNVNLIEANHQHNEEGHHTHDGNVDPHIWMSPSEMNVQASNIYNSLCQLMPDSTQYFKNNYQELLATIADTDKKIMSNFNDIKNRSFMIYHPAMSYFARDYQLKQIPLEYEGKEPSGKYMAKLIETSKEEGIKTIFIQKEFPVERAGTLANELNANVEVIDPLAYNWPENMVGISKQLRRAMNK
ncbi:MAG: zinc ABC transporter substrate-binding protein [Salinivirgaceae bacterium]|jgi:zinc transport system substrate-binding protein|nr:zinc ABC transporter substrate-binding protein [Salinivirgaceae bacterium]